MPNTNGTKTIPGCANHYTSENIYDLFMESDEDASNCNNCPNLQYVGGTMTCKQLTKIREGRVS